MSDTSSAATEFLNQAGSGRFQRKLELLSPLMQNLFLNFSRRLSQLILRKAGMSLEIRPRSSGAQLVSDEELILLRFKVYHSDLIIGLPFGIVKIISEKLKLGNEPKQFDVPNLNDKENLRQLIGGLSQDILLYKHRVLLSELEVNILQPLGDQDEYEDLCFDLEFKDFKCIAIARINRALFPRFRIYALTQSGELICRKNVATKWSLVGKKKLDSLMLITQLKMGAKLPLQLWDNAQLIRASATGELATLPLSIHYHF